jgi:GTP pyrophosphokinase
MNSDLSVHLLEKSKGYLTKPEIEKIEKAYFFAQKAHENQKRKTGDNYITHPLNVAIILADLKVDYTTIIAGLLHDVLEDTQISATEVEKIFGFDVTRLVNAVTKLGNVRLNNNENLNLDKLQEERKLENLRKMFIAMAEDIRVIMIRLADRLHNMQTLYALPKEKQQRIAGETLNIYAPIADRLGMGNVKGQLEDLSFYYLQPKSYRKISKVVKENVADREKYLENVANYFKKILTQNHIEILDIHGRAKHLYSLHKKMKKYSLLDLSKIYDLSAIRIIVKNTSDCYHALGVIHKHFKPLIGRIKDYISMPKPNGYKSLHTTIFCLDGKIIEVQIRTRKMHDYAENGIAAHWHYGQTKGDSKTTFINGVNLTGKHRASQSEIQWVKELADRFKNYQFSTKFDRELKLDFFNDRIFVFSPKGDVYNLPLESTPINFAYSVHSDIGNSLTAAKIDGKIKSLNYALKNGEIVEIITSKNKKMPSKDWLNIVKTSQARSKIKKAQREMNDNFDNSPNYDIF